jgi:transposase-like protein
VNGKIETLQEAIIYFSKGDNAFNYLKKLRWPNGACCPDCRSKEVAFLKARKIWQCRSCRRQFSVKVGTIFEDSQLPLAKWFAAMWMVANAKNGISSYEVHRALGVTQKTAWFMLHRIRRAMEKGSIVNEKIGGVVEADESYIGGLARNMHKHTKHRRGITGTGMTGKTAVMGLLERHTAKGHSRIVAEVVPGRVNRKALVGRVRKYVLKGSEVHTDALNAYKSLQAEFEHKVVDHAECYVKGNVHTNGLENFWSLLKRGIKGTYVSVEPFHLFRYLAEQVFRFNERKDDDGGRFEKLASHVFGHRLTYATLIGENQFLPSA